MIKPASLREALGNAIPSLRDEPEKLLVFIDQGHIVSTGAPSASFEYRYGLNVILLDFAGDTDAVFAAVVLWVRQHQSELLHHDEKRDKGIAFEADHLTPDTCDLSIKLALSESVIVELSEDGVQTMTHRNDSSNEWDLSGLAG